MTLNLMATIVAQDIKRESIILIAYYEYLALGIMWLEGSIDVG